MTKFVHDAVRDLDRSESSSVELAIVPAAGDESRVEEAVIEQGGCFEKEALGMLRVTLPADEVEQFIKLDCLRSVAMADSSISDGTDG